MQTDAQWTELGSLIEACRPDSKSLPRNLRRTITAILWHQNGTTSRAIPAELRPWKAAQTLLLVSPGRMGAPAGSAHGQGRQAGIRSDPAPARDLPAGGRACGRAGGVPFRSGAIGFDAAKHLLLRRIERRPSTLDLTVCPHLPRVALAATSAKAYMAPPRGAAP